MADEPDAVEEAGQAPVEDAPQAEQAAPDESTDIVTEDAASDEGVQPEAVTEGDSEAEVEQDTPEPEAVEQPRTLAQLRELYPDLAAEAANAGAQAREAELKREAGSKEQSRERVAAIKRRLSEVDDDDPAGLDFLWENAYANAAMTNLGEMAEVWGGQFEPTAEERAALNKAAGSGDVRMFAAAMLDAAARRIGGRAILEMDISEIPEDSKLAQSALALRQQAVEAEAKASAIEAKEPREPAPATAGRPVGVTGEDPDLQRLMQPGGIPMSDTDARKRAADKLGVKLPA